MWPMKKKQEVRADTGTIGYEDSLLTALLGGSGVNRETALQVPTIASAIGLIGDVVAGTPIKLYKIEDKKVIEIENDPRLDLLNDDTGDTLNAHDFWKAIVADYYLGKGGYAYINKQRNKFVSLHYVEESKVTITENTDPIFKSYEIMVDAKPYKPYDFLKVLRNTKDGAKGIGVTVENSKLVEVAYESLVFESNLVKKGGNKKGFLQAEKKLDDHAMDVLKAAFKKLYSNNSENVVVLNSGTTFKESSNTSVEMQLNENKTSNSTELCKIFHISPEVIAGKATDEDMSSVAKLAAIPLMKTIQCALNRDLLLEKEKANCYYAYDIKELLKGNFKDRMEAYGIGIEKKVMTPNEARYMEDLPNVNGLDVISMGLADVIFDTKTGTYFTPNTKQIIDPTGKAPDPQNDAGGR